MRDYIGDKTNSAVTVTNLQRFARNFYQVAKLNKDAKYNIRGTRLISR